MLTSVNSAPGYGQISQVDHASAFAQTHGRQSWHFAKTLRAISAALREGVAAHRTYPCLRRRGIPHDAALRHALGVSHRDQ